MSACLLARKHFVAIGAFVAAHCPTYPVHERLWCYMPDRPSDENRYLPERVANVLMAQNEASVFARYGECETLKAVTEKEVRKARVPSPGEMSGLLRSLSYQSRETNDWRGCEAHELIGALRTLALAVVAKLEMEVDSGHEAKTYTWA